MPTSRDSSPVRVKRSLIEFIKWLEHSGYVVTASDPAAELANLLTRPNVIVALLDRDTFEEAECYKDMPVYVYDHDHPDNEDLIDALDCGGLYTFVRYFEHGVDVSDRVLSNMQTKVPTDPSAPIE